MKRTIKYFLIVAVLMAGCAANQNFTKYSYQTLNTAGESYKVARAAVVSLAMDGLITDAEKQEAIELSEAVNAVYHPAVDALAAYEATRTVADKAKLEIAITQTSKALGTLMTHLRPILERAAK